MAAAGGSPTRVLVVSAAPDARRSTASLRSAVEHLSREPRLSVEWWFLRDADRDADGDDERHAGRVDGLRVPVRVVDHLRTSSISSVLGRLGGRALASRFAGLRLRRWWHRAAPDVVVLDDGLGGRVLPDRPPPVVVRVNPVGPDGPAVDEPVWSGAVAGRWIAPGAPGDATAPAVRFGVEGLAMEWSAPAAGHAADAARRAAGLPVGEPLVHWPAGGEDELAVVLGWLAGGDVRFDRPAHVVWVDPDLTAESHAAAVAAAGRVGVADRLHQRAAWSIALARAVDASVEVTAGADGGDEFDAVVRLLADVAAEVHR